MQIEDKEDHRGKIVGASAGNDEGQVAEIHAFASRIEGGAICLTSCRVSCHTLLSGPSVV
jgi:hypothetical protein